MTFSFELFLLSPAHGVGAGDIVPPPPAAHGVGVGDIVIAMSGVRLCDRVSIPDDISETFAGLFSYCIHTSLRRCRCAFEGL